MIMRALCLCLVVLSLLRFSTRSHAAVISGNIVDLPDSQLTNITDGTNSVEFFWSVGTPGTNAFLYAYFNTDVGFATGVTNVTQITDAGAFPLVTNFFDSISPVSDADANGGIGQFVVLKNQNTGHYAVVRFDDVRNSTNTLNATWWFQSDGSADFSSFVQLDPLAEAVDAPYLSWTTGGAAPWTSQTTTTFDGVDAAQSGAIDDDQFSYIKTTVQGPGTLIFKWRVSSEGGADFLSFYKDDAFQSTISGVPGWISVTNQIAAGSHELKWEYAKDDFDFFGLDRGWLDQVSFITPVEAVSNLTLRLSGSNAILSFLTQATRTHAVEASTNLLFNAWTPLTNVAGNGMLRSVAIPLGTQPERYFRVGTQ